MSDANGTHYSQMFYTKMWINTSQNEKKPNSKLTETAMAILLQATTGSVSSFYLPMQVSPHLNLVSSQSNYLSKIHFLEVFFSDIIMNSFKHTLYIQNTSNLYWNTSNGLLPDSAVPFPSHWCALQHCLHHNLSCHSHHLPQYGIYSNFLLSSILSVSQFIFYNSCRV